MAVTAPRPRPGERPWESLPARVAAVLRPALPSVADEIVAELATAMPEYADRLESRFGEVMRLGVEEGLRRLVDMIERPGIEPEPGREVYVGFGREVMRAGRTLDDLLAAYRLGARVAWRRFATAGAEGRLDPDTLYLLAESIFAYIDELSAESVEGYAEAKAAAAGEAARRRHRLVRLLVQEPPADPREVEAAAEEAGWRLPPALAAVAIGGEERSRAAARLPVDAVSAPMEDLVCAMVPDLDAPGRREEVARALEGSPAGVGPVRAWTGATESFARARAALGLAREGVVRGDGPVVADEHATELLLHADPALARDLAAARLAPLDRLAARSSERLLETLDAWLRHQGGLKATAAALGVHPQTVRYRLGRLRELLGGALDDPDGRFELELALRARAAAAQPSGGR